MLATILHNAHTAHDARPKPGEAGYLGQESADAVTTWLHLVHLVNIYANGADKNGIRPTWEAFWADGMDRATFLKLVARRSRITRALANGGDMDVMLIDDSVRHWEHDLARSVVSTDQYAERARRNGNREATHRLMLETEIGLAVIQAYTGVEITPVRDALAASKGEGPKYPGHAPDGSRAWESHPLLDLITGNRPTV